jgi:hypothetical protein
MSLKGTLQRILSQSFEKTNLFLSDLSDADLLVRPVPQANHIAWQLGHLILQEYRQMSSQDLGVTYPDLPSGFEEQHSDATAAIDPPSGFLSKQEYLDLAGQMHGATMATLASLSDADLMSPVKADWGPWLPTVGDIFLGRNRSDQGHLGQFAVVRLVLGKSTIPQTLTV